jgi:dihydrodipicolinate synthase/N-acetylneuraminate lyase
MSLIPSAPFKADLAPDSQRFIAHCKWLLSQDCGLAVFGTNSEANSLSMEERAMRLDELVAAGGRQRKSASRSKNLGRLRKP